ncbi:hypothetical protein CYMTET_30292 [Cymbomonas tetramitiformis]|uniref:Uncharacterized protein n=1 Tax=Cymbomonas tetramitiformis TaxID=36881 RepID=A0AAE0FJ57_9CHLO|nr:hypothetical protein CYMTET_30292 [Cymbomonas tetramitiformis]
MPGERRSKWKNGTPFQNPKQTLKRTTQRQFDTSTDAEKTVPGSRVRKTLSPAAETKGKRRRVCKDFGELPTDAQQGLDENLQLWPTPSEACTIADFEKQNNALTHKLRDQKRAYDNLREEMLREREKAKHAEFLHEQSLNQMQVLLIERGSLKQEIHRLVRENEELAAFTELAQQQVTSRGEPGFGEYV